MTIYDKLHEVEVVTFRSLKPRPIEEFVAVLRSQGFSLHDDVFSLDRKEPIPRWQHSSIVEVEITFAGTEVFESEDASWDTANLRYLFAYLPFDLAERFFCVVQATSKLLDITPEFRGHPVDGDQLRRAFEDIRSEVVSETGDEPGSESLAIFIHGTYPRQ